MSPTVPVRPLETTPPMGDSSHTDMTHANEKSQDSQAARPSSRSTDRKEESGLSSFSTSDGTTNLAVVAKAQTRRSRIAYASLCFCIFLEGWNDSVLGPLIPRIQKVYSVNYTVVSLIFVVYCAGLLIGAILIPLLTQKFGFGRIIIFGSILQLTQYIVSAIAPPFPAFIVAQGWGGFGNCLQNAMANAYVGSLKENKSRKLMVFHACYGVGALCSPLVATQFSTIRHWSYMYLVLTGLAGANILILFTIFGTRTLEGALAEAGQKPDEVEEAGAAAAATEGRSLYSQMLRLRAVHVLAIFALIYVGVEVTTGGWMATYIIERRNAGKSAGYISTGFFGGITIGRLLLIWPNQKMGEERAVYVYMTLAIGFQLIVWLAPNVIANGVAVSIVGVLLGPMFPLLIGQASHIIPQHLFPGSIGYIAGWSASGAAALPFLTGVLAQKFGIIALQPFLVIMMGIMIFLWILVPKVPKGAAPPSADNPTESSEGVERAA